ncbi:Lsr2 family protein [Nocardioides sp.]|uniref:histone-like nucleoid-structuring protein Lsr2 n=1 Tax=Nocardioides sp. TaxID=35761 RepID=UPI00260FE736|nr:Lsr2 family protein [Nocardioides sp.]
MAQKVQIILEDDIDGGSADETVTFGLDGSNYEIDLTSANADKLRDALAPFIGHARKVARSGKAGAAKKSTGGTNAAEVRAWARSNGFEVPERGRIPLNVKEAFDAAN